MACAGGFVESPGATLLPSRDDREGEAIDFTFFLGMRPKILG